MVVVVGMLLRREGRWMICWVETGLIDKDDLGFGGCGSRGEAK